MLRKGAGYAFACIDRPCGRHGRPFCLLPDQGGRYMKKQLFRVGGIAFRIYLHNLFLVLAAVLVTGGISLYMMVTIRKNDMDTEIRNMAYMVSEMQVVKEALESGTISSPVRSSLLQELDMIVNADTGVDIIVVCDLNSIRYYHNNHAEIGQHFRGGDQEKILRGAAPYISEAEGTLGMQRRAFCNVYNEDGERIGFVMASVLTASLTRIFQAMSVTYLLLLLLMSVVGAVLAAIFMQNLRRTLLGYQPEEIIKRYVERTDVLDAMEEGICAIDTSGKITVLNRMARRILGVDSEGDADSREVRDVFPTEKLMTVVHSNTAQYNVDERIHGSHIMSTRIPIHSQGRLIGAVSIMRDKTELVKMAEELTGANYMVDTLRAVHHEFKNKMHVILGLIEMEQPEKAREYILGTTLVTGEAISNIKKLIPISNLAAQLIGKVMRAAELDISLSIKADTHFIDKENGLPSECYITIVGNLVENAIDELNRADFPVKEIELGIYVDEESTIITCDDTGGGIPEDILINLYDRNTTTKGEGHGIGFSLIRDIVDTYEGVVHIDTEVGAGTSIEITLPI